MSCTCKQTDAETCPELPPYRPPSEAASILVRVTRGCAWNRCAFCQMYKALRFSIRSLEEIEADLAAWRQALIAGQPEGARERPDGAHEPADSPNEPPDGAQPDAPVQPVAAPAIFLGDADALVHPELPAIVRSVRRAFPEAERITAYGRLHTLWRRTPEFLRSLREAGLDRIHAGLESGAAATLAQMHKGIDPGRAIEGARKALAAGFELSLYVLLGLGGEDAWEAHARESARVVAAAPPHFLRLRSLVVLPGTPLHERWLAGSYSPASPITRLRETRLFVDELCARLEPSRPQDEPLPPAAVEIKIRSDHFSNYVWGDGRLIYEGIRGRLPADHALLRSTLDAAIAAAGECRRVLDPGALALQGRAQSLLRVPAL